MMHRKGTLPTTLDLFADDAPKPPATERIGPRSWVLRGFALPLIDRLVNRMVEIIGVTVLVAIVAVLVVRSVVGAEGEASDWVLARPLLWWVVGWPLGHTAAPTPTDPLGFAAWIGCLVTAMNLLPFGQLDGGHVMGAVAPRWQRRVGWATTVGLLGLGLAWPPWALWAGTLHLMGASVPLHPKAADQALDREGRALAALGGLAWLLCFTPVPTSW